MSQTVRHLYEFGPFCLDATERLLLREKHHIPLTPKAFETLLVLVEHGGHVIDKDQLMKKVWPDTYVEEVNLAKNVSNLRKILGADQESYIETIPKRGYRFVAGVREVWAEEPGTIIAERTAAADFPAFSTNEKVLPTAVVEPNGKPSFESVKLVTAESTSIDKFKRRSWAGRLGLPIVFLVLGAGVALGGWYLFRPVAKSPSILLKTTPVTSFLGNEDQAAFSPDGNQIAFVWNGEKEDNTDIYVKLIGAERPLRLTTNSALDTDPTWSPDGRNIAFLRQAPESGGVFLVPSLGGAERKLADVFPYRPVVIGNTLSFSPDGKLLAVPDKASQQLPFSIVSISVETGDKAKLTSPPAGSVGDFFPAFSPDRQTLAFVRSISIAAADIYLLPLAGGDARRLTFENTSIRGLSWTSDGKQIVFASRRGGSIYNLWEISTSGGQPERLTTAERDVYSPTISRQANRLAYTQSLTDGNIWRIGLRNFRAQDESPLKLISSTQEESGPQYSPDGKRIVFASRRSGSFEISVCDSDGTNVRQLTNIGGPLTGTPRWSPDGREIAFDSWVEGNADIYVIAAEGGKPRRLTFDADEDVTPSWSRDGHWVYFGCTRSGSMQIWKVPAEGGPAVQITKQGGFEGFESTDGRYFYYAKGRATPGIWRVPAGGGEETPVLNEHQVGLWRYWAITDRGIYFATAQNPARTLIEFFNLETGNVTPVARIDKPLFKTDPGLAVSPDGQSLLLLQMDQSGSDIVLAENFR